MTPYLLANGRLEDVTFASLAPLLRRRGYYLIHAFAAVKEDRCVLLVGPSGSGKTTAGLSLLLDGWSLLANDVLLLTHQPAGVIALPTPGGVYVRPQTAAFLPVLPALPARLSTQALIEQLNGRWASGKPVTAIYFPHVESGLPCNVNVQNRAIGLARLLEASVDRWDEATLPAHVELLRRLGQQTVVFDLQLGTDVDKLPQLMAPPGQRISFESP